MAGKKLTQEELDNFVAEIDSGGRQPAGIVGKLVTGIALLWAFFQLYFASNVPYWLSDITGLNLAVNNSTARLIHLSFGLVLAALAYPLFKSSSREHIPWYDWLLAIGGVVSCMYMFYFREALSARAGLPTTADLVIATIGMVVLAIAVFRTLGLPLLIVASVFVTYVFFGDASFLPDAVQWKGASYGKAMWHYWIQGQGVFGVALSVSASLIFLFVLFGSILEKAGAGNFFIKIAFALLGHLKGGPAKAAVVASAMSGLYSGSSIANTVTTGTFTIPLMKRTGFSAEKAGAVEVASSTNGQLTPPVMGAAAFLIAEFTGISYTDIIKHAIVPALVSYIALFYIVHLEACKLDLRGLPRSSPVQSLAVRAIGFLSGFIGVAILGVAVYYGLGWIKDIAPEHAFKAVAILCLVAYLILIFLASRHPDLTIDDPDEPITELPKAGATAITGLYYILPIVMLIWCIIIERLSPALSAFWATLAMIFVTVTQHPLKAIFRGKANQIVPGIARGFGEWMQGMIAGSRNMIGIAIATGAAGIIIGSISLTGAHQVIGEIVELVAGGNLMLMLILVAVMSLILGMGLPTTANYIVVSSLMAPVIIAVGAKSGLIVPLIAVHLFVFYFGILADDTPPVGLAATAAAAISKGDPIKTGVQGFAYDIRTALLPFLFIFNTELLLIDVSWYKAIFIFIVAVIAMMLFAAATQGWFLTRNRIWESIALLLVAFTLFRPGFWLDRIQPPFVSQPSEKVFEIVGDAASGGSARVVVSGPNYNSGKPDQTTLMVPLGDPAEASQRLQAAGLDIRLANGVAIVDEPMPGTPFFPNIGNLFDFYMDDDPVKVAEILTPSDRMPKELFYIPAFLLLGLIVWLQRRRVGTQIINT